MRDIRRETRRKYSAEEKIRIVLEGLRGEDSIAELCYREDIRPNLYYKWSKEFLEAGKARLTGETKRETSSSEVRTLKQENEHKGSLPHSYITKHGYLLRQYTFFVVFRNIFNKC